MLRSQHPAGLGALDATEAVGWGWSHPMMAAPARRAFGPLLLSASAGAVLLAGLALFVGFLVFVDSLERSERPPKTRADGIVALTGGSQRIGDAIDLLAQGYAGRLLISGVNEHTSRTRSPASIRASAGSSSAASISITGPATPSATPSRPGAGSSRTGSGRSSW